MLISPCNNGLRNEAGIQQCDLEEVSICQKISVKAEPLNGSIMPKAMVLLLALKAKMFSYTTVSSLAMVTGPFLKVRKLSLLLHVAIKAGKHRKFRRPKRNKNKQNYPLYTESRFGSQGIEICRLAVLNAQSAKEQLAVRS